jgi:hypothetical protein
MRDVRAAAVSIVLALGVAAFAFSQASATGARAACSDPMSVLEAFYNSNDAGRFDASMRFLTDDVVFATWATGVNGYIMARRHMKGKKALRSFLPEARGLRRRLPDSPADGPIYHEAKISVDGSDVHFMLVPDRKRPNGRLYNPFSIEAVLDGCRIKSLTVIERVTWL